MFRLGFLFRSQIMPRLPSKSGIRLRKEQEAYFQDRNTVTKICKESHISKFNNMGHRRYEHRMNTRRTKRSESQRVVRWLASAK